jgi:diadenylate cyclase
VIIRNDKLVAAHCIFPLTHDTELQKTMGTRHRAGIGITEETDAVAVIVSEETGFISLACRGRLRQDVSPDQLSRMLRSLLKMQEGDSLKNIFEMQTEEEEGGFSRTPLKK